MAAPPPPAYRGPRAPIRWPGALCAAALALAAGCSGLRAPRLAADGAAPWQIPPSAFGSQRLYRISYSGPRGEGSFRLTLRLAAAERYQVMAVDPVGRALWSLDVDAERGLWLDHRNRGYCNFEGSFDVADVPLAPFPLLSLPALLLDRLPAEPAAPPQVKGRDLTYRDEMERRWTARLAGDQVESWTLWEEGQPVVLWVRRDDWSILSDRKQGAQVRWKEVLAEKLPRALTELAIPSGFEEEDCQARFDSPDPHL
ncbi:MAG TPA: hypothetical protein VIH93_08525 [Thermoanaerobaculia bacterium]|jgi:hypothetical protein